MVIRIVKLTFKAEHVDDFLHYFETIKHQVNSFEGCLGMQLIQDIHNPHVITTYSHWENESALDNYRYSETFNHIWPSIKIWFGARPEAWTSQVRFDGFQSVS